VRLALRLAAWLVVVAVTAGCAGRSPSLETTGAETPAYTFWVVDHGWHTAIAVRRSDVDATIWPEARDLAGATFIEIGWGDRGFYMAERGTVWLAIKAAFITAGSVLHVVGFDSPIDRYVPAGDQVALEVSRSGFAAMSRFFHEEYQRDEQGRPLRLAPGPDGASWFYAAGSRYHLFNTCNTWVVRALRAAGLDVTPAGVVIASSVMREARRVAAPASR